MLKTQQEIVNNYQHISNELSEKINVLKRKINKFSIFRLGLLLAEVVIFIWFVNEKNDIAVLLAGLLLIVPIAIFIFVVKVQNQLKKKETDLKNLLWVYENEINVINNAQNGYSEGREFENEDHAYLSDLDVFGKFSLYAIINRCSTKIGKTHLANLLAKPGTKTDILARQESVKEILNYIENTFDFRAKLKNHDVNKIELIKDSLKGFLADQLKFTRNRFLRFYVKLLPYLIPGLLLGGLFYGDFIWGILMLLALIHAALTFYNMKQINQVYYGFSGGSNLLNDYATAIEWTENIPWKTSYILSLFATEHKVSKDIKALVSIITAFDARLNIIVSAVLNFLLLWDLRCSIKLDEWHQHSSSKIENALNRIGYFEELISMATFTYNDPHLSFPLINDSLIFDAHNMGHPLIGEQKRVNNTFDIGKTPAVNIITGSNMAGKSTFLRTIGINMVLAYAGAPVSATYMKLSIFNINTYMRIKDSLNESTSTFKAELNRLKMILENVTVQENALVLIDEMLRGTNSHDKYLGSKVFIEKMISSAIPTLFATHDLHLAELEKIHLEKVANYHFDIQIEKGEMNFDYKLKKGPCTIFNAAILLKEIGLSLDIQNK
jgi:hypothetical protein